MKTKSEVGLLPPLPFGDDTAVGIFIDVESDAAADGSVDGLSTLVSKSGMLSSFVESL
jgi:hypothetical protein